MTTVICLILLKYFKLEDSSELYDFIRGTKGQVKVHITDRNVWGWSKYYYNNAPKKDGKKDRFFAELRHPSKILGDLIYPWKGKEEDFALINDLLNDPKTQKSLGCFYTPLQYSEKAVVNANIYLSHTPGK